MLGVMWLAVGLLLFGGTLMGGTVAEPDCPQPENQDPEDDSQYESDVVCSFPADNYDGGLVMGTTQLAGDDLGMFDEDTADEYAGGIDDDYPRETDNPIAMPAGAANDAFDVDIASIGFGVEQVNSLFSQDVEDRRGQRRSKWHLS